MTSSRRTRSRGSVEELRSILNDPNSHQHVLFVTGAGISVASGVALYRSKGEDTSPKRKVKKVSRNPKPSADRLAPASVQHNKHTGLATDLQRTSSVPFEGRVKRLKVCSVDQGEALSRTSRWVVMESSENAVCGTKDRSVQVWKPIGVPSENNVVEVGHTLAESGVINAKGIEEAPFPADTEYSMKSKKPRKLVKNEAKCEAIWNKYVEEWATVSNFRRNIDTWYQSFWIPTHFTLPLFLSCTSEVHSPAFPLARKEEMDIRPTERILPNDAHKTIRYFMLLRPDRCKVITQNVDGLHLYTGQTTETPENRSALCVDWEAEPPVAHREDTKGRIEMSENVGHKSPKKKSFLAPIDPATPLNGLGQTDIAAMSSGPMDIRSFFAKRAEMKNRWEENRANLIGGENPSQAIISRNLIEAHGRISRFRCASTYLKARGGWSIGESEYAKSAAPGLNDDKYTHKGFPEDSPEYAESGQHFDDSEEQLCPFAHDHHLEFDQVVIQTRNTGEFVTFAGDKKTWYENLRDNAPPLCMACGCPCLPVALLFDESYAVHESFEWRKIHYWLSNFADIIVFVGTSFSVLFTDVVLAYAYAKNMRIFNMNLSSATIEFHMDTHTQLPLIRRFLAEKRRFPSADEAKRCSGDGGELFTYSNVCSLLGPAGVTLRSLMTSI